MIRLAPSIAPSVDQRAVQGLAMSVQLAQAIGLLSLGASEIESVVAEHVERNPFLSRAPDRSHADIAPIEAVVAAAPSLHAEIAGQVRLSFDSPGDRAIAMALVAELDDAGYLRAPVADLAERLGVDVERVERVLGICRGFEPSGLFARDLTDCLTVQLDRTDRLDAAMRAVLAHLPLLASGGIARLAERTGLDRPVLDERIAWLRACDPKPGARGERDVPIMRPVARIVREPDASWGVRLLTHANPRVRVDHALAHRAGRDAEAREFVRAAIGEARWLERALARRARSVRLVVGELARAQADYLERGDEALRPLSMRTVSDAVGVHESTVSRICAAKSVETPRGTVALRSLFGAGVASSDGALAGSAVRHRIGRMIEAETARTVLSDDAIAARLNAEGVAIARRTVAKYREALAIAPSNVRRRAASAASRTGNRRLGENTA